MDTGEVWVVRYDALLAACAGQPALLTVLHEAMSREISRDRDSLMSVCTLPADARVADFLRYWAESLARRGMRTDQITLRMTRAEIGNYLGMTLETVSRALSHLARCNLIGSSRRAAATSTFPSVEALADFVQRCLAPAPRASVIVPACILARGAAGRNTRSPAPALARVGLAQQLPARRRVAVGVEQLGREARHQQDRQLRKARCASAASCGAAHAGAERDVGEQQVEAGVRSERAQRLLAAGARW